jgi:choline dehydrogenase-like flavoprotein
MFRDRLSVSAKVVVSSCGSIHTPAFLLRSGCKHPLIGKHLSLHPVIGTGGMMDRMHVRFKISSQFDYFPSDGLFRQNTGLATGVSMGVVVKNPPILTRQKSNFPADYRPERFPVAIENPPVHMGILGLILPWNCGLQLKVISLAWKQFATFLGISRDKSLQSNRVDIDRDGNPVIHYTVADHDKPNLLAGLEMQLRMQRAAGAKAIFYGHSRSPWYVSKGENDDTEFESFLDQVRQIGVQSLDMQIFSAHQMSSCRMGSDETKGPVSRRGSLYECKNLFVADGSVLPTSLGINPMITIFAFAHMISAHIIEELKKTSP